MDQAKANEPPSSSIAHVEGGGREPSFDNLRQLAKVLHMTTDNLLEPLGEPDVDRAPDPIARCGATLIG